MKYQDKFTNKDISKEWPERIIGNKVIIPKKDSYKFTR